MEHATDTDKNIRRASEICKHLEGTLIADLKSLEACALTPKESGHGSLNFTIFLVGLLGCETLGMYVYGADLHQKAKETNSRPDVGAYITRFIETYFPNKDHYKLISKVLSDYLRHTLVHGFAPREDGYPFDLELVIGKKGEELPPLAYEKNNRLVIKLYGISFLNKIIAAFEKTKSEMSKNSELARKIVAAEDYSKKHVLPPKEVLSQFIASYPKFTKSS